LTSRMTRSTMVHRAATTAMVRSTMVHRAATTAMVMVIKKAVLARSQKVKQQVGRRSPRRSVRKSITSSSTSVSLTSTVSARGQRLQGMSRASRPFPSKICVQFTGRLMVMAKRFNQLKYCTTFIRFIGRYLYLCRRRKGPRVSRAPTRAVLASFRRR
jgi:hypothetical protein